MRDNSKEEFEVQGNQGDLVRELAAAKADYVAALPQDVPALGEAYAIQRQVFAQSHMPVMVWKLGLTSDGARAHFGVDEPAVGRLSASAIYASNSAVTYFGPEMYAEAELVVELAKDLPEKTGPYTRDDICEAIGGIYAGIEIVRSRFTPADLPLPLLVADNVMGHGLVWGQKLADRWEDRFAGMPVTLTLDADEPVTGSTSLVLGNPLDAVVWLANWLRDTEGERLRAEQLIATGTCTGATLFHAGNTIRVDFDGTTGAYVEVVRQD
tara:strand:- start:9240 stop:10043 length:804 start_codon:yes stop_codon:yes gene_type:complete